MNADGTMMRGAQVAAFARTHALPVLTIDELVALQPPEAAGAG
jgi:3,4-dihydroxy-2-butanone 4-phosphate synthase